MLHKTYKLSNGNNLEIHTDESPESPRAWDNLGTMVCFHRRYNLGDKHDYDHDNYDSWDEMKEEIIAGENVHTILPLYLYDHSGVTISTSPFSCRWDSGQIGFIFISKKKVEEEGIDSAKVQTYLEGEVETYDQYLRGDVYGFIVKDQEGEQIDSCWGFFGDNIEENGIMDHVEGEIVNQSTHA